MASVKHVTSPDGTLIAYRAWGSGDPILFVHGSATSGADWVLVARHLRDRFTVVAMDRRGRGASGDASGYTIESEAEDVLAVLDEVGAECLVAHSFGALCAIVAAGKAERLRRLVLYEPPIAVRGEGLSSLEELVSTGELDQALTGFLRVAGASGEDVAAIRSSPAWPKLLEAVPLLPRELRSAAAWVRPGNPVSVPTLFLQGADTNSEVYLDGLAVLKTGFSDRRSRLLPGQTHFGHAFDPETFARTVAEFLSATIRS